MKNLFTILLRKRALLIVLPLVAALFLFLKTPTPSPQETPSISEQPTQPQGQFPGVITLEPTPFYDEDGTKKLTDRLDNPIPLTRSDQEAKQIVINNLNKESGVVSETPTYAIEYVKSADLFMVEIRTVDVGAAKREVAAWFKGNGFSERAICELPVVFYLNFDISQTLREDARTFNPLGEGC